MTQTQSTNQIKKPMVPPHSTEAEKHLIGNLILNHDLWDIVSDVLNAQAFYHDKHRIIFENIAHLASKDQPFDALSLTEHMKQNGSFAQLQCPETLLFDLANITLGNGSIISYCQIIIHRAALRRLLQAGQQISQMALDSNQDDVDALIDQAESCIFAISDEKKQQQGPQKLDHVLALASEKIDTLYHSDKPITGIETGFTDIDKMTSGLQKSDLFVIAGRPSMGKTILGINFAQHAALHAKHPVVIFSLEMPSDAIAMRMLSSIGKINQHRIRTGKLKDDDWPLMSNAIEKLSQAKMYIDDSPSLSPYDVRSRVRKIHRRHGGVSLIVIDYLQLMKIPGIKENRTLEISEISRMLKALAKEVDAPVVALSQLNRSLEQRQDKRPVMSDLRESGAIEQDADVIAFIYRDEVYNEHSPDKGTAEVIIAKHRNGPIGKVRLAFMGEYTSFENYSFEGFMVAE